MEFSELEHSGLLGEWLHVVSVRSQRVRPTGRSRADGCVVSSGDDASDLEGVSRN